jgi:hypothetical protein
MNKYKRVILDLGYVVRDGDEEMERHAMISIYDDIMCLVKHDEVYDAITVIDAPDAKEEDIPEFLLETEEGYDEDFEAAKWQRGLA